MLPVLFFARSVNILHNSLLETQCFLLDRPNWMYPYLIERTTTKQAILQLDRRLKCNSSVPIK